MEIYNFEAIDQSNSYIKVANLFCENDKQAIKQAKRIDPDCDYDIRILNGVKRVIAYKMAN